MKTNQYDTVLDGVKERVHLAQETLKTRFKNTNKFRQEPVSDEEQLAQYDSLGVPGVMELIAQYGADAVQSYVFNMEQLKQRRMNDGRRK